MDLKYIFWEDFPTTVYKITEHSYISDVYKTISFYRDDNYKIICRLEGVIEDKKSIHGILLQNPDLKQGDIVTFDQKIKAKELEITEIGSTIEVASVEVVIEALIIKNTKLQLTPPENKKYGTFFVEGEVQRFTIVREPNKEPSYTKIWWLNSEVYHNFNYNELTSINSKLQASIVMPGIRKSKVTRPFYAQSACNAIRLKLNDKNFVFGSVNSNYTSNLPASFLMFTQANALNDDEISIIQSVLSFIIGKTFIPIGFTTYNKSWLPLTESFYSSVREDLGKILSQNRNPAIPVNLENSDKHANGFPQTINQILENYYSHRETFPLNDIMFYINTSRLLPLVMRMQPLATAMDLFLNAWFKSSYSESQGKHLHEEQYSQIISKHLEGIKKDLDENKPTTEPIINRIKKANFMSSGEKYETIFKEIVLPVDKVEKEALKARNTAVHGSLKAKEVMS